MTFFLIFSEKKHGIGILCKLSVTGNRKCMYLQSVELVKLLNDEPWVIYGFLI